MTAIAALMNVLIDPIVLIPKTPKIQAVRESWSCGEKSTTWLIRVTEYITFHSFRAQIARGMKTLE